MLELYLISRLDAIIILMAVIFVISLAGFLYSASSYKNDELKKSKRLKEAKLTFIIMIISVLGLTATPSTKDAYIIYGAGSVIEYIKEDTTAKQIPHKAIVAIDKYLESVEEDKK